MEINTENFGYNDKLSFNVRWIDKKYLLDFYPYDGTLQLKNVGTSKIFVKRIKLDTVAQKDIYIGNTLIIFNRLIQILDYANIFTKELYGPTQEEVLLLIKPTIKYDLYGRIIRVIEKNFQIINLRMCKLSSEDGIRIYKDKDQPGLVPALIDHITSGPSLAIELRAFDAVNKLRKILGNKIPAEARKYEPNSLRALYGVERITNGFHHSGTKHTSQHELGIFFRGIYGPLPKVTAVFKNSALCIIKPHAVKKKIAGEIIQYITENNFTITMMQIFHLDKKDVDDFLESYMGVVDNFFNFTESFLRGPALILEVGSNDPALNVFEAFRHFTGPRNPDINSRLKPFTLRARFGEDKYHNAVYCSDLETTVIQDLKFFFETLQK